MSKSKRELSLGRDNARAEREAAPPASDSWGRFTGLPTDPVARRELILDRVRRQDAEDLSNGYVSSRALWWYTYIRPLERTGEPVAGPNPFA